jgi:NTP pyrophosphatase (non-canonical NTP hydrolase)
MNFSDYQKKSRKTAKYPRSKDTWIYPVLGLCGESGEVAEKMKKIFRDCDGKIDEVKKEEIKKELGDVLWYISQIATELNLSMDDIANSNIKKLYDRMDRNALKGSGDNR